MSSITDVVYCSLLLLLYHCYSFQLVLSPNPFTSVSTRRHTQMTCSHQTDVRQLLDYVTEDAADITVSVFSDGSTGNADLSSSNVFFF